MWSDRRSRDAGYHHAVSTRRPEKLNRILVLVNSERFSFVSSPKSPKLSADSIQILTNLKTKVADSFEECDFSTATKVSSILLPLDWL